MLAHLRIRDFVLIDELDLEFKSGFNALTGETGAGKSLIATALNLLLGRRGSGDLVRRGADTAEIEGVFDVSDEAQLKSRLAEAGLGDDDELLIRRVIPAEGRHRCYVNGRLCSLGLLAEMSQGLANIMSQHEQHSLGDPARQLTLLDGFGQFDADVEDVATKYKKSNYAQAACQALKAKEHDRTGRLDYLSFQLEEIERISPEKNELEGLEREVERLKNAEQLNSAVQSGAQDLYEGDNSVYDRLGVAIRDLEDVVKYDDSLESPKDQLIDAAAIVEEAARFLIKYAGVEDASQDTLEELDDRLDELRRLVRKHNTDLDGVLELRGALRSEISTLSKYDEAIADAEANWKKLTKEATKRAAALTKKRKKAAKMLAKAVTKELKDLSLGGAIFDVAVEPLATGLGPRGADKVEFLVRLNEGEGTHPIAKIASGGELSRLMLAIKRALLGVGPVGTYVFDEVDAGIGGAVAASVGKKLKDVAAKHQVVCITHLPQIAGMADAHFMVSKKTGKGRTTTRIATLSKKDRIEELARMLGGETVTNKTRAAARELVTGEAKK